MAVGLEYCLGIPDPVLKKTIISALSPAGHSCVGEGKDCHHFLRTVRMVQPQLAVLSLALKGNVVETASIIEQEALSAVLLVEGGNVRSSSFQIVRTTPFVTMSVFSNSSVLLPVIEVLYAEFVRRKKLIEEMEALKSKLLSRTVIERAKGVIMKEKKLDEQESYRFLQKESMNLRLPIIDVAQRILKQEL